jgi:formylglycine-generating enzyme required for sulfatase activity
MRVCFTLFLALLFITACAAYPQTAVLLEPKSMVDIPAGWFHMGSNDGPASSRPQRYVYLDAFAIDRTEVTNSDFTAFVAATDYQAIGWDDNQLIGLAKEPVVGVLWRDADAYCRWAGKRLPTEAEWEKAARGTDGRRFPWGDKWDPVLANTAENGPGGLVPVGIYPSGASPYGALDMAGNAAEWVADYFDFRYYSYAPSRNPQGPSEILGHGLRGGSWASPADHAQTFFRDSSHAGRPNLRVGFRCAKSLTKGEEDCTE